MTAIPSMSRGLQGPEEATRRRWRELRPHGCRRVQGPSRKACFEHGRADRSSSGFLPARLSESRRELAPSNQPCEAYLRCLRNA